MAKDSRQWLTKNGGTYWAKIDDKTFEELQDKYWADEDYYNDWIPKLPAILDKKKYPFNKHTVESQGTADSLNIAFKGQDGYIEKTMGLMDTFEALSTHPELCILWIPYSDDYIDSKTVAGGILSLLYTDVEEAKSYMTANRDAILGLLSKYVFKIDTALQFGINYISSSDVNKILNSYFTLGDGWEYVSDMYVNNYQEQDNYGKNYLTFLDGYQGVAGWSFTFPINFRIMFNNFNYDYLQHIDFKTNPPFTDVNSNLFHYLYSSRQLEFLSQPGLKNIQGTTKPTDFSDYGTRMLWEGNERSEHDGIAKFTGQRIERPIGEKDKNLRLQYGVYTPTPLKYVFEQLYTADVNDKLNNNILYDTPYFILRFFKGMEKIYIKAYVEPSEKMGIFYFNYNNLNIFIENIPNRKTLFMSIDNQSALIGDVGFLPFKYDFNLLSKDVNMLFYSENAKYLNYCSSTFPAKNDFIYTILEDADLINFKIVLKGEKSCITVYPDGHDGRLNNFTYYYEPFNSYEYKNATEFFINGKQTGGIISGGIRGGSVRL